MRIVHIITRFVDGGADENTMLTCNHQAEAGHDVWLAHGGQATERMLKLLHPNVRVACVEPLVREVSLFRDFSALLALSRLIREVRPDVVHTHTSKAGVIGRLAAIAAPEARVVHGVHILPFTSEPFLKRSIYVALEKIAALRTHAFIDVSEGMRDLCLDYGLGSIKNHFVIYSGMDVARFREADPSDDLAQLRRSMQNPVLIGYVAVLERRKRHREVLFSLLPLLEKYDDVRLILAGEGPERSIIEEMIAEKGLADRVHLLGFRDDVERVLAGCDICVFGSEREGLPRSMVQYVLARKPVVAMTLPGIERVVHHGKNGFAISSGSFDEFSEKVGLLVEDDPLRATFAAGSAAIDLSAWDADEMAGRIEQVYRQILSSEPTLSSGRKHSGRGVGGGVQ